MMLYGNGSFATSVVRPFPHRLVGGEVGTSLIRLTGSELGMISGSLTGLVTATQNGQPSDSSATAISISVSERPASLPPLAILTLPAAPTSIDDQHPGVVVARVTDLSTLTIDVGMLKPTSSDSITITADKPFRPFLLQPGQSRDVSFVARTSPNFDVGSHVISFLAEVSTPDGTRHQDLVSDKSVMVSVFGEAQISSVLGAVSFLFVPGFLILVVFKLLWEQYSPRRTLPWLGSKNPEFWVGAISLSLIAIPVYYGITALYGPRRNLVTSSDSYDILRLWVGSLIVGGLAWLIGWVLWTRYHILPQNSAYTVVQKLARRREPTFSIELTGINGQQGTFGVAENLRDVVVMVPRIKYAAKPAAVGVADQAVNNDQVGVFWDLARQRQVTLSFEDNRTILPVAPTRLPDQRQRGRIVTPQ
jgi:hypothetical protein